MPTRISSQVLPKARHQHPRWRVFLSQNKMKLFLTAFLQVFFVSANTYFWHGLTGLALRRAYFVCYRPAGFSAQKLNRSTNKKSFKK